MSRLKKCIIPMVLVLAMIVSFVPYGGDIFAASLPIDIYVESYDEGELVLYWNNLANTKSVTVKYHYPDQNGSPVLFSDTVNQTVNMLTVQNLEADIIYDIEVVLYNGPDGGGSEIGRGFLYFLPKITFYASRLDQERQQIGGGGYETGVNPGLNLRWVMPKVYTVSEYVYANQALDHMEARIGEVYNDGREIQTLNFRINMSTDYSKLNGGSSQAAMNIISGAPEYSAYVSGNPGETCLVHGLDSSGYMNFDVIGRKDADSDPAAAVDQYQLRNWDILPGTVYYMNIKPIMRNSLDQPVNVLSVGDPANQNGSLLSGPFSYAYTPLRFQLTRDSLNNIYVKIFKVNEGSLDMPRLYYQVQTTDDPSIQGDWIVRKTLDDTYFEGEFAVTVISGISPDNEISYKIVAKTDSYPDRLESPGMAYTIVQDTTRPPIPDGIYIVDRKLNSGVVKHPQTGEDIPVKSSDIKLEFNKPAGWEDIKDDLYFHILLSTEQTATGSFKGLYMGEELLGNYPVEYRLVKYFSAVSPNVEEIGDKLIYTLNGFELFTWEDETGLTHSMPNDEGYPDFLVPNKVYYLQLYTAYAENKGSADIDLTSERSLTRSFTTLSQDERDVPLPHNITLYENGINEDDNNEIVLQFSGINEYALDWSYYTSNPDAGDKIYYDIYMGTRTQASSFVRIGSTDGTGDVLITMEDTEDGKYITAAISSFTQGTQAYNVFGEGLKENTIYYFILKTRLAMVNEMQDRESEATAILPVTTVRKEINPPDQGARRPLAPVDFSIALDEDGMPRVTGSGVSLAWTELEENVSYRIVCTAQRLSPNDPDSVFEDDPLYKSFISNFGDLDSDGDSGLFVLDKNLDIQDGFFEYDSENNTFILHIKDWLYPNRLYYFSIKAVLDGNESAWVSIPVTTYLIEMPTMLEAVNDIQIGFNWTDTDPAYIPDDHKIHLRAFGNSSYQLLERSKYSLVKDGTRYYARLYGLKGNSTYDIRVYRGDDNTLVYEAFDFKTRDVYHELHIKWKAGKAYSQEVAFKGAEEAAYNIPDSDEISFYTEKDTSTSGTEYLIYHAILSGLESNARYFIKVRSKKTDPLDSGIVSYSKYTPSISTRTEFSQDDYDDEEEELNKKIIFLDKVKNLEKGLFWIVDINNSQALKLLVKEKRAVNLLESGIGEDIVIDASLHQGNLDSLEVFIPSSVLKAANEHMINIIIKMKDAQYIIRPQTLKMGMDEIEKSYAVKGVKDVFVKICTSHGKAPDKYLPEGISAVTPEVFLAVGVFGTNTLTSALDDYVKNVLYDEKTGLVNEKLNKFVKSYTGSSNSTEFINYVNGLVNLIGNELSVKLKARLKAADVEGSENMISSFKKDIIIKTASNIGSAVNTVYKKTGSHWEIFNTRLMDVGGSYTFNSAFAGSFFIGENKSSSSSLLINHPDREYFYRLQSEYDLDYVFMSFSYNALPDSNVKRGEIVLLYEVVMGLKGKSKSSHEAVKAKETGLDKVLAVNSMQGFVNRQELAAVLYRAFGIKTGLNPEKVYLHGIGFIDEKFIQDKFYTASAFAVSRGLLESQSGYFKPDDLVTRASTVKAFVRLLELTKGGTE